MATDDKNRFRKTYSFFRNPPVYASGGGGGGGGGSSEQYWYSTTNDSIYTTGSVIIRGDETGLDSPFDVGSDVFFYVSGSIDAVNPNDSKVAVFGGDLVVSGAFLLESDYLEITGTIVVTEGISGSLTKLADGTSYLVAGANITIVSASNGQVTISSTGGSGSPAGSDNEVQFNNAGSFGASSNFTYDGNTVYITGSLSQGDNTFAAGDYSHAEGTGTFAIGTGSHAEGTSGTEARGDYSHAEGEGTSTDGYASHSEGTSTLAKGDYSHVEGNGSAAVGEASHAEGLATVASGSYQHAEGRYNLRNNDHSLLVIGNGTGFSNAQRSDIVRVEINSVQITGSFIQTNSGSSTVGFMGNEIGSASSKGSDVFFYVSGSTGTTSNQKSLFGGDLVVSGSLFTEGDRLEMTGTILATNGFSGSLTTLVDGTSYLVAGNNVTITSQSNGSIVISSTGGGSNTINLQFLAGTVSSVAPSGSMESVGMDYLDTSVLPVTPTYTFSAILATTLGTTAYMDLYDYNGIFGGTPGPVSGSVLTGSNQSYTYLTADVTAAMTSPSGNGIIEARIWCDPTGSNLNAICKSARLTIS